MHINILISKVKDLNLPIGKFVLFGSAPLAIRGIREANDIDILVTEELWSEYRNKPEWKFGTSKHGSDCLLLDDMEMFKDWKPGDWDVDYLIKSANIISELPFVNLDEVMKAKSISLREEDIKDIELIKKFINL